MEQGERGPESGLGVWGVGGPPETERKVGRLRARWDGVSMLTGPPGAQRQVGKAPSMQAGGAGGRGGQRLCIPLSLAAPGPSQPPRGHRRPNVHPSGSHSPSVLQKRGSAPAGCEAAHSPRASSPSLGSGGECLQLPPSSGWTGRPEEGRGGTERGARTRGCLGARGQCQLLHIWPTALSELQFPRLRRDNEKNLLSQCVCEVCVTTRGICKCRMVGRVEGHAPQHPV